MANLKEIEIKWDARNLDRSEFNKKMRLFLVNSHFENKFKHAYGFDYYYESETGRVARHRSGIDINELTVKARTSNKSTTIRHEANIKLSKDMPVTEIECALGLMGFKHSFSIYKDCDIYFIEDGKAEISIVWYTITMPQSKYKVPERTFFEIEVHNIGEKESLKLLKKWEKMVAESLLGLNKSSIIPESLYEIYTGKKYRLEKVKTAKNRK